VLTDPSVAPAERMGFDTVEVSIFRPNRSGKAISLFAEGIWEFYENRFHFGFS
jgi:hypothetical protein